MPTAPSASRSPSPQSSAQPQSFTASPSALRGHGGLAAVSAGTLYLIGGAVSGVRPVTIQGQVSEPAWSHDGRWLAVAAQPAPPRSAPYTDEPMVVWLVSRDGAVVRRITPSPNRIRDAGLAWSPTADRLAISYVRDRDGHVDVVDTEGSRTSLLTAPEVTGVAWSPDGERIAVGRNRFVKPATRSSWRSEIDVVSPSGGRPVVIAHDRGGVYDVATWWPDGSGVLAWIDPMGSGSIAADGLPLYDVGLDGRRRYLTGMLRYRPWIATSKKRDEVALIAGGDRELTNDHKHLAVCTTSRCRSVSQPKRAVSFDPAFAPDGRLAFVRDRAVAATAANGAFGASFTAKVDASGGIEVLHGEPGKPVPGGDGASAPVWGRDGTMLEEKGGSLWLLADGSSDPRRIAGPLGLANGASYFPDDPWGYYGFVGWWDSFAWSGAAAGMTPG